MAVVGVINGAQKRHLNKDSRELRNQIAKQTEARVTEYRPTKNRRARSPTNLSNFTTQTISENF